MENKKMGMGAKNRLLTTLSYIILCVWVVITLVPIVMVVLTAFKTDGEISMANFRWLPSSFTYFDNFKEAWKMVNWSVCFGNSFLITVLVVVGSLLFNSLAGYAFARLRFKGRDLLFMTILLGMMVSPQSIIIPQYVMMRSVPLTGGNNLMGSGGTGLLDSYVSLIVPFLSGAFGIFL